MRNKHRWALLLKQQTSITFDRLLTKETNFCFPFPVAANKRKFAISAFRIYVYEKYTYYYITERIYIYIYTYIYIYRYIYIYIQIHIYIYTSISNGKWKPRHFSLIRLPFAHCTNGSLSFVRLLTKKQTEVIRLQTD
jgi:hypothetical protein